MSRSELLVIGGASGVGKSSAAFALHDLLSAHDVQHAVVEGDALDLAYPAPWRSGIAFRNLAAIWDNYKFEDAVIRAVKAGNDILIFSNDKHPDVDIPNKVVSLLSKAAKHDAALQVRIEQAYENILAMKQDLQAQAPALDTISTRSIGEGESRPVLSSALMTANKRDFPLYLPADL